ncbi:hypothetical protein ABPG75_002137 [Micractinium tetrahymenae]
MSICATAACRASAPIALAHPAARNARARGRLAVVVTAAARPPATVARPPAAALALTEADKPCLALQPYDPLWQGIAAANPDLAPLLESVGSLQVNILPKATGRAEPPRWALSRPPAYDGTGAWSASAVYVDLEARVDPALEGMPLAQVEGMVRREHAATVAAIKAATAAIAAEPACTAAQLRGLLCCHGAALARVAPGGASALLVADPWLPLLMDCSARAAAALLRAGRCRAALAAATATLQLASHLSFGTCDTALPCAAAIRAAQGIVRAAAEAGTPVTPTDAVQLLEAAARADPCLRLGKWYGHAFGDTVERHIADGWGSAELALRYLAAWCALVAAGTLQYTATRHEALVEAVMKEGKSDRPLSAGQRRHLLATERTLPAECTSTVNTWLAGLPAEVERRCGTSAAA